ncbi:hypothetical protein PHYSODRAFT_312600 [Phytophthora sojae]|uniref:Uncharacterized protein n=1 Tax=Phytophthora sojae (strain P6497) TaxID=1094619 RepID=G4Z2Z1_PHYSP|nr:hypothetical protein PHYSODRAFT_312600 [Phytophthora sojae]EGZ19324.1 hypothetical protein PHYSODRAFT_312600 [Phytophthora sojae]|eukprot:XP_009522041.1 hypothetical protein PHYSODRAFT_312600 [Phytophthora sojae]
MVVSPWAFALWWFLFLALHTLTLGYNAAFAFFYFNLRGTMLNNYLEFFWIGMPSAYHPTIATVHAAMATLHGVSMALMLGGTIWWRTLAFTPWGGPATRTSINNGNSPEGPTLRTSSRLYRTASSLTNQLTDRYGLLGVNGKHFHTLTTCREIVETTLQTVQGYRMSWFLPSTLLNQFFAVTLALNCWSSAIVYALPFRNDEARRRFALIACDCVLDLISCVGVTLIVVLRHVGQYDTSITGFDRFQMVLVVSWSDLVSRAIFSLGLFMTTASMKELLYRRTRSVTAASSTTRRSRLHQVVNRGVHALFLLWGCLVLALHVQASLLPTLPQCLLQVRPWAVPGPSCYLVRLDCHHLNISGDRGEIDSLWRAFDGSSVVMMLIRHCPSLDVPDVLNEFHEIRGFKVYNSTIVQWRESAAITNTNHPNLASVLLLRVNMSDGLLPAGFQSSDFPRFVYDFEMCVTNLREVPDDLHTKWNPGSQIFIEYIQLRSVPTPLLHLVAGYFSLTGNPISELPPELFETEGVTHLMVGDTSISELPHNSSVIPYPPPVLAGGSAYCGDLKRVLDGNATSFSASTSGAYSAEVMDPANLLNGRLFSLVDCSPVFGGPLYPLAIEDLNNAIRS